MRKKIGNILFALLYATVAVAAVQFRTTAPGVVAEGEVFRVQFTVNTQVDEIKAPNWGDFKLLAGPFSSVSSSTSVVNGHATSVFQQTETYTLEAVKAGTYTIPGATMMLKGKAYKSNSVKIVVTRGGGSGGSVGSAGASSNYSNSSSPSSSSNSRGSRGSSDKDLFIRTVLSKTNVYEQECVLLTYKLYYTKSISSLRAVKVPDWNNFGKQEVEKPDQTHHLEVVNGRQYETVNLYQVILYPTKAGTYTLDPADFEAVVQVETGAKPQNFFDAFLDTYENVTKPLHAPGATLHAQVVPKEGRPGSFKGAVGHFNLQSKISSQHVKANEPITLTLTLTGQGNLKMIGSPTLTMPQDFEVYDPKVNQKIHVSTNGVSGEKTIEYMLIPREEGQYTVPAIEFSYFDPDDAQFKTLRSPSYDLQIDKGAAGSASSKSYQKGQRQALDIRYIDTDNLHLKHPRRLLFRSWWASLYYLLPLLLVLGTLLWQNRPMTAEERKHRTLHARAQQHLKNARHYWQQQDADKYLEEMQHATETLFDEARTEDERKTYGEILEQCQQARYAPNQDLDAIMKRIESLLKVLVIVLAVVFGERVRAENLVEFGNQNYAKGDYAGAVVLYEKALQEQGEAPELYYNLGNAYYKSNRIGPAVLSYERALKLRPLYRDARYNLNFVQQHVLDDCGANYVFFLKAWWQGQMRLLTPNGWAWTSIVCFWLFLAMLILYVMGRKVWQWKVGFFVGLLCLLISAVGAYDALRLTQDQEQRVCVVVVAPVSTVYDSAQAIGKNRFVVHEGTEARVIGRATGWLRLEFGNGSIGWVKEKDVESI